MEKLWTSCSHLYRKGIELKNKTKPISPIIINPMLITLKLVVGGIVTKRIIV